MYPGAVKKSAWRAAFYLRQLLVLRVAWHAHRWRLPRVTSSQLLKSIRVSVKERNHPISGLRTARTAGRPAPPSCAPHRPPRMRVHRSMAEDRPPASSGARSTTVAPSSDAKAARTSERGRSPSALPAGAGGRGGSGRRHLARRPSSRGRCRDSEREATWRATARDGVAGRGRQGQWPSRCGGQASASETEPETGVVADGIAQSRIWPADSRKSRRRRETQNLGALREDSDLA